MRENAKPDSVKAVGYLYPFQRILVTLVSVTLAGRPEVVVQPVEVEAEQE